MPMCCAIGCSNKTHGDRDRDKSFHLFPFSKPETLKLWIHNVKRENWVPTRYSVLCSDHFTNESFDRTGQTVRLKNCALPSLFNFPEHSRQDKRKRKLPLNRTEQHSDMQLENTNLEACETNNSSLESHSHDHDHHYYASPKKLKLNLDKAIEKNKKLANQLKTVKERNSRLKKKVTSLTEVISTLQKNSLVSTDALEVLENTFTGVPCEVLQRMLKNISSSSVTREQYPPLLRKFALTLQFYSTKAYNYVRDTFSLALPHPSVLRNWCSNIDAEPGFSQEAAYALEEKVKNVTKLGKKVICSLMLDEMSIKKHVEWDGKQYRGFIDIGTGVDGDDLPLASEALVFMVVSLDSSWKIPVAYYFIKSLTGEERANLVSGVIAKLFDLGVVITSLTCDGPSCHFAMMRHLGANLQLSNLTHWFPHPCDATLKVYVILDVCHMLKLIRNSWAKLGIFKANEGLIEWRYITALHEMQEKEGLRAGNKLKLAHVQFYQQKMKVNLAAQTLSDSVADALTFCCDILKLPQFKNVEATVKFIKFINKLFDILNSRNPFGKGSKAPLSKDNKHEWMPFLTTALQYLEEIRDPSGKPMHTTPLKTPFIGFYVSVKSVMSIFDDVVESPCGQLKYLLTYKFSQDHLELLFCAIRARGGWNNNPNAIQFISAYRRLLLPHTVQNNGTNIEAQDGTTLLNNIRDFIITPSKSQIDISDVNLSKLHDVDMSCDNEELEMEDIPELRISEYLENTIAYISGYVVKMVMKVVHCSECIQVLHSSSDLDVRLGLLNTKSRGYLIRPSEDTISVCLCTEKHFKRLLLSNCSKFPLHKKRNIVENLSALVLAELANRVFLNLSEHMFSTVVDSNHVFKLIKCICSSYIKIRLYHEGKRYSEKIHKQLVRKSLSRLVIVKHQ